MYCKTAKGFGLEKKETLSVAFPTPPGCVCGGQAMREGGGAKPELATKAPSLAAKTPALSSPS